MKTLRSRKVFFSPNTNSETKTQYLPMKNAFMLPVVSILKFTLPHYTELVVSDS